ncbi:putative Cellulose synthase A catalytic subunit 6 [UDP-forming] [Capsicum annuum]|nr:putative Cellulose synthase A catalytic subunit 6 [UDP-forming] [Capsicum annuum]
MEGVTEGVNNMSISETQKKNRIQVSNTKKSLFFYVNLSKVVRCIKASAMREIWGRAGPRGSVVSSLALHFCKRYLVVFVKTTRWQISGFHLMVKGSVMGPVVFIVALVSSILLFCASGISETISLPPKTGIRFVYTLARIPLVRLRQRYMQQYNEVELSALGMAISTVVTIAEILKNNGFAVEKKIRTLTVDMRDEPGARPIPKAKIEIVLGKTEKFDELMAAEAEQNGENEEQN